jgi:hypothetical protein
VSCRQQRPSDEHEIINDCARPWPATPGNRDIEDHRFGVGLAVLDAASGEEIHGLGEALPEASPGGRTGAEIGKHAAFPTVAQAIERWRGPRRPRFGTTTQDRRRIRPSLAGWKRNGAGVFDEIAVLPTRSRSPPPKVRRR